MTLEEAEALVQRALDETGDPDQMVVDKRWTRETEFGWLMVAETAAFLRTGDPGDQLPGVGPVVVERDSGEVTFLATDVPPDQALDAFLAARGLA